MKSVFIDLSGQIFGNLTVIKRVENSKNNRVSFLCECKCGALIKVESTRLVSGNTKSCGCYKVKYNFGEHHNINNLLGKKFGEFTATKMVRKNINGNYVWEFRCSCGVIKCYDYKTINKKKKLHCGCLTIKKIKPVKLEKQSNLKKEIAKNTTLFIFGKPFKKLLEYSSYRAMLKRCYNKNHEAYNRYAGKNIIVCDYWKESFINFYNDMAPRPSKNHSLERIDNTKGYCKENCRWATMKEQGNNRYTNKLLTYNNETLTYAQWSEKLGGDRHLVGQRIKKGWSIEKSLTTTIKKRV